MLAGLLKLLDLIGFIFGQIEKNQEKKVLQRELEVEAQERINEVPKTEYTGDPKRAFDWLRKRNTLQ
jgi:hypothetical protein